MRRQDWMRRQTSSKSDTCTERRAVDAAGRKREGGCVIPGEICQLARGLAPSRGGAMSWQKSAEGIVAPATGAKARTRGKD